MPKIHAIIAIYDDGSFALTVEYNNRGLLPDYVRGSRVLNGGQNEITLMNDMSAKGWDVVSFSQNENEPTVILFAREAGPLV